MKTHHLKETNNLNDFNNIIQTEVIKSKRKLDLAVLISKNHENGKFNIIN